MRAVSQSTLCTAGFTGAKSYARPVVPGKACEEVGPFCGAGRLLDRARLLLGVASKGKLLLMAPGPCLPTSDIASLDHCLCSFQGNPLLLPLPPLKWHATSQPPRGEIVQN